MIVDILTMESSNTREDAPMYGFYGSTTLAEVDIQAILPGNTVMRSSTGNKRFQQADNVIIESIRLAVPHGLKAGSVLPVFSLSVQCGAQVVPVSLLGPYEGNVVFPQLNEDVNINALLRWNDYAVGAENSWYFRMDWVYGSVSMSGLPSSLDNEVIRVVPVMRVRHTLAMWA